MPAPRTESGEDRREAGASGPEPPLPAEPGEQALEAAGQTPESGQPDVAVAAVPESPAGLLHTFRALRHRNFRLFISGQIVSLVGTWMQNVAQSWLVYRLTHSELLLGTAWFCAQIAV